MARKKSAIVLAKDYELDRREGASAFYHLIWQSVFNGNRHQARNYWAMMDGASQTECRKWLRATIDADEYLDMIDNIFFPLD